MSVFKYHSSLLFLQVSFGLSFVTPITIFFNCFVTICYPPFSLLIHKTSWHSRKIRNNWKKSFGKITYAKVPLYDWVRQPCRETYILLIFWKKLFFLLPVYTDGLYSERLVLYYVPLGKNFTKHLNSSILWILSPHCHLCIQICSTLFNLICGVVRFVIHLLFVNSLLPIYEISVKEFFP